MESHHEQAAVLYRNWGQVVETCFRLLSPALPGLGVPFSGADKQEQANADTVPDSIKPIAEALNLTRGLLGQFYGALVPSLGAVATGQDWQAWASANADRLKGYAEAGMAAHKQMLEGGLSTFTDFARAWSRQGAPLSMGVFAPFAETRTGHPQLDGLERTFGALTDAFGLEPSKALRDAWRELIIADEQRRTAQLEYLALLAAACSTLVEGVAVRLSEMAARGEQVDSFLSWVRLWASVADKVAHEAMQSEAGLKATSDYIRAALRYRQQRNRLVEVTSELLNVPTRAELDEAYREIQQLKRQMRELRRERQVAQPARRATRRKAEETSRG